MYGKDVSNRLRLTFAILEFELKDILSRLAGETSRIPSVNVTLRATLGFQFLLNSIPRIAFRCIRHLVPRTTPSGTEYIAAEVRLALSKGSEAPITERASGKH